MRIEEFPEFIKNALMMDKAMGVDDDLEVTGLYDSTGKLMVMAAISNKFNKLTTGEELSRCKTCRDLFNLVLGGENG